MDDNQSPQYNLITIVRGFIDCLRFRRAVKHAGNGSFVGGYRGVCRDRYKCGALTNKIKRIRAFDIFPALVDQRIEVYIVVGGKIIVTPIRQMELV